MPVFLLPLLARFAVVKTFVKAHAAVAAFLIAIVLMVGSSVFLYERGHSAGKQAVQVEVEKEHTETIKEVRDDEHLAQDVADKIGSDLTTKIAAQHTDTTATLKDMQDALNARPALPAGCPSDVAPAGVLASSNALVDRANRAAGAADAPGGTDADGAASAAH